MSQKIDWNNPEARREYNRKWRAAHRTEEVNGDLSQEFAMSHEEIAKQIGVSRARVWQIEQAAMNKIRQEFFARGIQKLEQILPKRRAPQTEPDWQV